MTALEGIPALLPTPLLAAALEYAARGWPILPLAPRGKLPLTNRGHRDATTAVERIRAWWGRWPDANVGVATGGKSGLLVLDVDTTEGEAALIELGALVPTLTCITAKGRHLYFAYPAHSGGIGCRVRFRPGLDSRGEGGYVVAPPSAHESGTLYQWDDEHAMGWDLNPAPLPERLCQALLQDDREPFRQPVGLLLEGYRNDGLTRLAGSIAARVLRLNELREALLANNQEHCSPPLPQKEVEGIAKSIWQRECKQREQAGRRSPRLAFAGPAVMTFAWKEANIRGAADLKYLGFLLDLTRLISGRLEMPIPTGRGNARPAYVAAGEAEIAVRFIQNRWGITRKPIRTMLDHWQAQGVIEILPPFKGRLANRVRLREGWVVVDQGGANLQSRQRANLRDDVTLGKDRLSDNRGRAVGADLSHGLGATSTNKGKPGEGSQRWVRLTPHLEVVVGSAYPTAATPVPR